MTQQQVSKQFQEKHQQQPLLVFSPGRLNIIGEHTDYNQGFVFPAAISKGIYAAFGPADSSKCKVTAIDMKESFEFSLEQLSPLPGGGWRNYILGVVHGVVQAGKKPGPFHLVFGGDIPGGAGLSSSAALENAVVYGLNELYQLGLSKNEMINISQKAEHDFVGVKCGIMDQFASMFGQKDKALLLDCRTETAKTFPVELGAYQLLLINTKVKHSLADSAYNKRRQACENVATALGVSALRDADLKALAQIKNRITEEDYQMASYVIQENERVQLAGRAMAQNDIAALGRLLYASHQGLQHQYKVSCPELDFLVDLAQTDPAIAGARMMGGGFGGCTINIIKKTAVANFSEKVRSAYFDRFGIQCALYEVSVSKGTHLI